MDRGRGLLCCALLSAGSAGALKWPNQNGRQHPKPWCDSVPPHPTGRAGGHGNRPLACVSTGGSLGKGPHPGTPRPWASGEGGGSQDGGDGRFSVTSLDRTRPDAPGRGPRAGAAPPELVREGGPSGGRRGDGSSERGDERGRAAGEDGSGTPRSPSPHVLTSGLTWEPGSSAVRSNSRSSARRGRRRPPTPSPSDLWAPTWPRGSRPSLLPPAALRPVAPRPCVRGWGPREDTPEFHVQLKQ